MRPADFEFTNNIKAAVERRGVPGAWLLLAVISCLLVVSVIWAHNAEISQTAVGSGRVIPSSQVQVVENLEPGSIREILVSEGDSVQQNQIIIKLDETASLARLGELLQKQSAFTAEYERLDAQSNLSEKIVSAIPITGETQSFYGDQQQVLEIELKKLGEQLSIRRQQLEQKKQSLAEAKATLQKQTAALELADRELNLTEKLFKRRAIPEIEFLRIQRIAQDLRGDIAIMNSSILRLGAEVAEAEELVLAEESAFSAKAIERKSKVAAELSIISETIKAAKDAVRRKELRAPVGGIINQLNVATLGQVVQSGTRIAEIVPEDDRLLIEARITPKDIAFVRPGLNAKVRLSAYDYTKFGVLEGVVERIGADTITDDNQETFYRVIVSTNETSQLPDQMVIIPGMIATVDVETGKRSILEYLLKPVLKIRDSALREPT